MKPLLLILALAVSVSGQKLESVKNWKLIKEMSGPIRDHPGLTIQISAPQIARGNDRVKLLIKAEFPGGAPRDIFKDNVPWGFDPSSISLLVGKLEFNCTTL